MSSIATEILIQGGSRIQQEYIARGIEIALSQSQFSKHYISTVLGNNDFLVEIDLEDQPSVMAWYSGRNNKIVFFLNHPQWDMNDHSHITRLVLHEFWHAFCAILHAPKHDSRSYPGDPIALSLPFVPKGGEITAQEFAEAKTYLREGHAILSNVLLRYLSDAKNFEANFPLLRQELKKCSEKYKAQIKEYTFLKTETNCETSYPQILEQLNEKQVVQVDNSLIIHKYNGETENGCKFLGRHGHIDWPPELNQVFFLYSEVAELRREWSASLYRHYYRQYVSAEHVELYVNMEQAAHTMEMGCFTRFYDRFMARLLTDIQENRGEMDNAPTVEEFTEALSISTEMEKEIETILKNPLPLISPEEVFRKKQEEQNDFGLKLFMAISSVPQLMGAGLSLFLDAGEKYLSIAAQPSEVSPENETNSSATMYLAAGCTLALLGAGYYCFWRSGHAKNQAVEDKDAKSGDDNGMRRR